jgi:hypothetical protein
MFLMIPLDYMSRPFPCQILSYFFVFLSDQAIYNTFNNINNSNIMTIRIHRHAHHDLMVDNAIHGLYDALP